MMKTNTVKPAAWLAWAGRLGIIALALAACAAPTAVPPTATPTRLPPTATAMPPTAMPSTSTPAGPAAVKATSIQLSNPTDIAIDAGGNLYVSECEVGVVSVYRIDTFGLVTPYVGLTTGGFSGDGGPAINAETSCSYGLAIDHNGNLYLADYFNNRIRKIDRSGIINTVVGSGPSAGDPGDFSGDGGPAASARLNRPTHSAIDAEGNLYIADGGNYRIRKVDKAGIISTVAGSGVSGFSGDGGPATAAQLDAQATLVSGPGGIALDAEGNLYIADMLNYRIRKVDKQGIISTVAGSGETGLSGEAGLSGDGGPATSAKLGHPTAVAVDAAGNLYVAIAPFQGTHDNRIRRIDRAGIITTVVGTGLSGFSGDGGPATAANISNPSSMTFDRSGNLYFADAGNARVRKVDTKGIITTVAGGAP